MSPRSLKNRLKVGKEKWVGTYTQSLRTLASQFVDCRLYLLGLRDFNKDRLHAMLAMCLLVCVPLKAMDWIDCEK